MNFRLFLNVYNVLWACEALLKGNIEVKDIKI